MALNLASSATAAITTVMKGSRFEERSLCLLREHLSMSLRRVGGKGDGGIDLQGWWWLPAECLGLARPSSPGTLDSRGVARRRLRVIAQCKAEEKKIGPRYIRELEGTVLRNSASAVPSQAGTALAAAGSGQPALVGLFISISPFTKASLLQAYSSPIPLALLHLPEELDDHTVEADSELAHPNNAASISAQGDALPGTLVFNPALSGHSGLLQGMVEPRWERAPNTIGHPGLWSNRKKIPSWTPEDEESKQEAP
ncbi:hypothetical protein PYCCODRAFT_388618 [Trametes coccinea BRFM310]|uniref:Restriction endonuclease type IV Mrr domain-containing protein n=1 Tax=Trametes coccinea (strain BRFM310) TaxID=1353009 RepID=A0A1Y2J411_TRAC3|nr:hypothetical protein PYCCODRAFT_388618 [Trametes coccinea BRFM310]